MNKTAFFKDYSPNKQIAASTLLGLLAGGTISSLIGGAGARKGDDSGSGDRDNEILVPLSRRHFLKSVRPETIRNLLHPGGAKQLANRSDKDSTKKKDEKTEIPATSGKKNVSALSTSDLADLKRRLLLGKAASCQKPSAEKGKDAETTSDQAVAEPDKVDMTSTEEIRVTPSKADGEVVARDEKGRFSSIKSAGLFDTDPGKYALNILGGVAGVTSGTMIYRAIRDKIAISREKKRVANARRIYSNMLANEVEDEDAPYYNAAAEKTAQSLPTKALGLGLSAAALTSTLTGLVTYRIMENRRLHEESSMDSDQAAYPNDKIVRYAFTAPSKRRERDILKSLGKSAQADDASFLGKAVKRVLPELGIGSHKGRFDRLIGGLLMKGLSMPAVRNHVEDKIKNDPSFLQEATGRMFKGKPYAGIAKAFAGTDMAKGLAVDRLLEATLPRVQGSTALARHFKDLGGNV